LNTRNSTALSIAAPVKKRIILPKTAKNAVQPIGTSQSYKVRQLLTWSIAASGHETHCIPQSTHGIGSVTVILIVLPPHSLAGGVLAHAAHNCWITSSGQVAQVVSSP